jgi:hypothetical protein
MRQQNFANHTQLTPAYHLVAVPLGLAYLVWAIARTVDNPSADTGFALLGAAAIVMAMVVSRLQALKVQDRTIRHEERLRLAALLPPDLQPHIGSLRASHLIALRFASDAEVEPLVRRIIADPSISPKAIKQSVREWRADWFRA